MAGGKVRCVKTRSQELAATRRRVAREREVAELGQQGLFGESTLRTPQDTAPRRSSSPPCTSRETFREMAGTIANQKLELLTWMQSQTTPLTSAEIAALSGLDRHGVARRLSELERDGNIRRRATRLCEVGHRPAITWEAI